MSQIYKQDAPGVVTITSTTTSTTSGDFNPFGPGQSQEQTSQGSGFVIDMQGRILTNAHVVEGANTVTVAFEDGVSAKATVLGRDQLYDLAVIKVDVPASELHPLKLGTVDSVEVGDPVVAIGNPFGYAQTVTAGIVSAKGRILQSPEGNGRIIPNAIQTDAAINHGNSGGPLIDRHGDVIAINAQIADPSVTGTNANAGVGFAIPIDLAKRALANLEQGKPASHPYLGIRVDAINSSLTAANGKLPGARPPDRRRGQGLPGGERRPHGRLREAGRGRPELLRRRRQHHRHQRPRRELARGPAGGDLRLRGRRQDQARGDRRRRRQAHRHGDGRLDAGQHPAARDRLLIVRTSVGRHRAYRARPQSRARYAGGVIAEVYEVEGVHCPRCIEKIAAALADIDGLLAADANLMGEITVRLDGPEARYPGAGRARGCRVPRRVDPAGHLTSRRQGRSSLTARLSVPACEWMRTSMRALLSSVTDSGTVSLKSLRPITQRFTCSVRSALAVDADLHGDLSREALRRPGGVDEDLVLAADPVGAQLRERQRVGRGRRGHRRERERRRHEGERREKDAPHMLSA